jgi:hypothetical protein
MNTKRVIPFLFLGSDHLRRTLLESGCSVLRGGLAFAAGFSWGVELAAASVVRSAAGNLVPGTPRSMGK